MVYGCETGSAPCRTDSNGAQPSKTAALPNDSSARMGQVGSGDCCRRIARHGRDALAGARAKRDYYETVPVERGSIQANVTATGTLNAVVDVLVSSQVSGNIKALYADWNTKVKKGQLVALIDPEIFPAQVDQATATYRSAHSASITAQAQVEKSRSDLSAAVANEKNAEAVAAKDAANAANAKAQLARAEILLQEQVMDQQDYDTAKATYDAAQAQVTADQSQIDAANHAITSAQAQVVVAQNQLASAQDQERETQAALQQAQINLDHTRIMAPVDGTVIARRMDVGQTVASSLNPPTIFEIAQDLTKMQVDTNVDESDVGNIALAQKATFTVDSYPDAVFHGVVADVRKAPIVTQNVVTYDVVITVDNTDLKLFPGMTANATILTRSLDNTLKVPNSVLRFRPSAAVMTQTGLPPVSPGKPASVCACRCKAESGTRCVRHFRWQIHLGHLGRAAARRPGCRQGHDRRRCTRHFNQCADADRTSNVGRRSQCPRSSMSETSPRPTIWAKSRSMPCGVSRWPSRRVLSSPSWELPARANPR